MVGKCCGSKIMKYRRNVVNQVYVICDGDFLFGKGVDFTEDFGSCCICDMDLFVGRHNALFKIGARFFVDSFITPVVYGNV